MGCGSSTETGTNQNGILMSYCSFGSDNYKSDVYVFRSENGWRILVTDGGHYELDTLKKLKDKLLELKERDYYVPDYALKRIDEEINGEKNN